MEYWRRKWATEEPPIPLPMMHTVAPSPPAAVEEEVCGKVKEKSASKEKIFSEKRNIFTRCLVTTSFDQDTINKGCYCLMLTLIDCTFL